MPEGFIKCLWLVFCCGVQHSRTERVNAAEIYGETRAGTWPILLSLEGTSEKKQGTLWKAVSTGLALSATLLVTVTEDVAC